MILLQFGKVMYHICSFAYIGHSLHTNFKFHLMLVNDLDDVLFHSINYYSVVDFYICVPQGYRSIVFFFLILELDDASLIQIGKIPCVSVVLGSLRKTGIRS